MVKVSKVFNLFRAIFRALQFSAIRWVFDSLSWLKNVIFESNGYLLHISKITNYIFHMECRWGKKLPKL